MGGFFMKNYEYLPLSYKNDLSRLKLPKFQRKLVWTDKKKNALISTLHEGFPFGALLVAPLENDQSNYMLLDGQQRLSTIKDYSVNKSTYWEKLNPDSYKQIINEINEIIKTSNTNSELSKVDIDAVKPNKSIDYDEFNKLLDPKFDLADWTDNFNHMENKTKKRLRNKVKSTREAIENYIDLDSLQIPVIKFMGKRSDLPQVFENLNKGGVPLSKYDVFNASWSDDLLQLPTDSKFADEILNNVKNYYINMNKNSEFEVDDFSEDDITSSRTINLAEFGRSLGEFVAKRMPSMIYLKGSDTKVVNEIGFGLLAISVDISNKKIAEVNKKINTLQTQIKPILTKIDQLSKRINDVFSKILKQNISFGSNKKSKKQLYATGLTTTFKLLSYFASLWYANEEETTKTLLNIPSYYVYDFLTGAWTGHGDQRLYEYYHDIGGKNYLTPINAEKFTNAFEQWLDENNGTRKSFSNEIKALITIHSNFTYLSARIPNGEDFEFEHIIPKARVLNYDTDAKIIHLSSLGNGMFLPKHDNNKKKDKTLYEFGQKDKYSDLIEKSS